METLNEVTEWLLSCLVNLYVNTVGALSFTIQEDQDLYMKLENVLMSRTKSARTKSSWSH